MNTLHEVVYQIVSNSTLLAEIMQQGPALLEQFNLASAEKQALSSMIQNSDSLRQLLAADYVPSPAPEQAWIP